MFLIVENFLRSLSEARGRLLCHVKTCCKNVLKLREVLRWASCSRRTKELSPLSQLSAAKGFFARPRHAEDVQKKKGPLFSLKSFDVMSLQDVGRGTGFAAAPCRRSCQEDSGEVF